MSGGVRRFESESPNRRIDYGDVLLMSIVSPVVKDDAISTAHQTPLRPHSPTDHNHPLKKERQPSKHTHLKLSSPRRFESHPHFKQPTAIRIESQRIGWRFANRRTLWRGGGRGRVTHFQVLDTPGCAPTLPVDLPVRRAEHSTTCLVLPGARGAISNPHVLSGT